MYGRFKAKTSFREQEGCGINHSFNHPSLASWQSPNNAQALHLPVSKRLTLNLSKCYSTIPSPDYPQPTSLYDLDPEPAPAVPEPAPTVPSESYAPNTPHPTGITVAQGTTVTTLPSPETAESPSISPVAVESPSYGTTTTSPSAPSTEATDTSPPTVATDDTSTQVPTVKAVPEAPAPISAGAPTPLPTKSLAMADATEAPAPLSVGGT